MAVKFRHSAWGIGDAVCGAYAAAGVRQLTPDEEVIYCTRHPDWLRDVKNINVQAYRNFISPPHPVYDIGSNYKGELKSRIDRKSWYCKQLPLQGLEPARPQMAIQYNQQKPKHHVVLAPFAMYANREWPLSHWLLLEKLLAREGFHTIVTGTGDDGDYRFFESEQIVGRSPSVVRDLLLESYAVISNDSGIAHFAGMY